MDFSAAFTGPEVSSRVSTTANVLRTSLRRASQFHQTLGPRAADAPADLEVPDAAECDLPSRQYITNCLDSRLGLASIVEALPENAGLSEPHLQAALGKSDLEADMDAEDEAATAARRDVVMLLVAGQVQRMLRDLTGEISKALAEPIMDVVLDECQIAADAAVAIEHRKVQRLTRTLNVLRRSIAEPVPPPLGNPNDLFEQSRYENFLSAVEKVLSGIDRNKKRAARLKAISRTLSDQDHDRLCMLDSVDADESSIADLFKVIDDEQRKADNSRIKQLRDEVTDITGNIRGQYQQVHDLLTDNYPVTDDEWLPDSGGSRSTRDFKVDKQLDLCGKASDTTGERWINLVSLFTMVNGMHYFMLIPGIVRAARQRSATGVPWQTPTIADWQMDPADLPAGTGFHVSKLTMGKQVYSSQNQNMYHKLAASPDGDDACNRATSGTISTQAGTDEHTMPCVSGDFISTYNYFVQYHFQLTMVTMQLLTQFFFHLPDAIRGVQDIMATITNYRQRLSNAIRVGVRFTYGGVFMPAYLAFIGRHSAFVQFLKRWNPKPPEVEETNPLAFMDAFLCDAERGVRTIRDIHPPERGSGRSEARYTALLADISHHDDGDTSAALSATNLDADKPGRDTSHHLSVACKAHDCERWVSRATLQKTGLLEKAKAGADLPHVVCDKCAPTLYTDDGLKMKDGSYRKVKSRNPRRNTANLARSEHKPHGSDSGTDDDDDIEIAALAHRLKSLERRSSSSSSPGETMVPLSVIQRYHRLKRGNTAAPSAPKTSPSVLSEEDYCQLMQLEDQP